MTLSQYHESKERRQMSGQLQPRGTRAGVSSGFLFLFGIPFFAVGVCITLIGLKVVQVDPSTVHAPYWVLQAAGGVFALGGVAVWSNAWKQWQASRRRERFEGDFPDRVALSDYPWNRSGYKPAHWAQAAKSLGMAVFLALFLSMFNWWAFFADGGWFVKAFVLPFNLFLLFIVYQSFLAIGRAMKFGESAIEFTRFPYRLSEPVSLRWLTPSGINAAINSGSFTLRCMEQWYEVRGTGKNRRTTLIQEEIWSGTWDVSRGTQLLPGKTIELRFEQPADLPPTCFNADRPIFWECEVNLDMPGFDFKETYLVPVYRG